MNNFDFEELRKSILTELNRVRADPMCYIPILENMIPLFKGDVLHRKNQVPIQTAEGPAAFEEAIKFLKKQRAVNTLTFDERLAKGAIDHINDIGPKGLLSHDSTDGRTMSDRIEAYCEWDTTCGESIDIASKSGQEVIVSFLVDDGIPSRGHRDNLFRHDFKYVGIACGPHKDFETIVVIDFTGGLREQGKPFFDYENYKYEFPKDLSTPLRKVESIAEKRQAKPKNTFQLSDADAPDDTVGVKMTRKTKLYNGKKINITKKYYTLENGTQHIVEVEEF